MTAFYPNGRDHTETLTHSRSFSTLSNELTNRTYDSHPTEPLLRSPLAPTADYYDHSSRKHDDMSTAGRPRNPLHRNSTPIPHKSLFRNILHAFKRRTKPIILSLELIIGIWASYNAVRYLLAFSQYRSTLGQALSLTLAITAGISAVLTIWAMALSTRSVQEREIWHSVLLGLRQLSAFFLLAPAAVNIAVVFVWKTNSDLDLHARCHLDVDVVWSIVPNKCPVDAPSWSLWVTLSFIRFLLTASLITIYMTASFFTFSSPKSSHRHSRSNVRSKEPSLARITSLTDHHPSDLTLVSDSSPQRRLPRLMRSRSFDTSPDSTVYGKPVTQGESDREVFGFVDRFRSLITQFSREVEDSLEAARSNSPSFPGNNRDYKSIPKQYPPEFNDIVDANDDHYDYSRFDVDNMFNLPPLPMALGYNEFGVPYPPEERVRVMGALVKRMPTIESMGSGEIASVASYRPDASGGRRSFSRPPTRTTSLTISTAGHDAAGSNPPSRANSASSRSERLVRISPISPTSEHGELLGRINHQLSPPTSVTHRSRSSAADGTMSSLESRGTTTTYHTATMGSYSPTYDSIPVERDT